ncbi:hypothetical protein HMPREF9120_00675 [Neisseria sp. oral taxon 020 str. F0370]|nr:hypothetical protein HMPREF9120_00675 [Neisseria sp. oral taxon 020 str. F0370]
MRGRQAVFANCPFPRLALCLPLLGCLRGRLKAVDSLAEKHGGATETGFPPARE